MKKINVGTLVSVVFYLVISMGRTEFLLNTKIIIIFLMGIIASYYQADYHPFKPKNNEIDKGTVLHIIWTVYLTQALALIEAFYFNYPKSLEFNAPAIIFLIMALIGLWYRSWAYISLGKFFTMHLETQKNHKIIDTGPYKFIRHPSYTGAFLTYVFIPLAFESYYSAVVSVVLFSWAFYRRITHEEAMLEVQLGEPYKEFCSKRSRLFPGIY